MSDLEYRIGKLEVKPGDCVVVKVRSIPSSEMAARIRDIVKQQVPVGAKVLVIDRDTDLSVLAAAEIDGKRVKVSDHQS